MSIYRCASCGAINRISSPPQGSDPICGRCKQALDTSGAPQEVDADALASAVASAPVPVVVDFWAPWCPPCRQAAPVIDRVARARAGRVLVLKVNTEANPAAATPHRIQSIPTFIAFSAGREQSRQIGLPPPEQLSAWVDASTASS